MNKNSVIISNRKKELKKVTLIGILVNVILMIMKLTIGVIFNSNAMIADGIHSIEDMISSLCSFIGIRLSSKISDKKHPSGYGKIEYFVSLIISFIMIITAMTMFKTSISNFINKNIISYSNLLLIVCIVTIVLKVIVYIYTNYIYIKTKNILVFALKADHRNDIFIMFGILIGIIFSIFDIFIVDIIISVIISIWICITSIKIFKSSYDILVDINLSDEKIRNIENTIYMFDEIKEITKIVGKPIGQKYVLLIRLKLIENYNIEYICNLRKKIKSEIISKFEYVHDVIFIESL